MSRVPSRPYGNILAKIKSVDRDGFLKNISDMAEGAKLDLVTEGLDIVRNDRGDLQEIRFSVVWSALVDLF